MTRNNNDDDCDYDDEDADPSADANGDRDDLDSDDYEEQFALDEDSRDDVWMFDQDEGSDDDEDFDDDEPGYDYGIFDDNPAARALRKDGLSAPRANWAAATPTEPRSDVSTTPTNEFHLDLDGYHPYLLLTEKPANVTQLIAHLRETNYEPTIAGNSRRPASNGRKYAFYVRIGNTAGGTASMASVLQPLGIVPEGSRQPANPVATGPAVAAGATEPDLFRIAALTKEVAEAAAAKDAATAEIASLRNQIAMLEKSLATAQAETTATRALLEKTRSAMTEQARDREQLLARQLQHANTADELRAAAASSAGLVSELQAASARLHEDLELTKTALAQQTGELDALWKDQYELDKKHGALLDAHSRLESQHTELTDRHAALESKAAHLEHALNEQKRQRTLDARRPSDLDRFAAIHELCPDLRLLRESDTIVEQECERFQPLFEKLFELQQNRQILGSKRVQSCEKWMEIHFSTGAGNDGRLYYRHDSRMVLVLVSRKNDQPGDIRWMRNN